MFVLVGCVRFYVHVKKYFLRDMIPLLEERARTKGFSLHVKICGVMQRRRNKFDHGALHPIPVKGSVRISGYSVECRGLPDVVVINLNSRSWRVRINRYFKLGEAATPSQQVTREHSK